MLQNFKDTMTLYRVIVQLSFKLQCKGTNFILNSCKENRKLLLVYAFLTLL